VNLLRPCARPARCTVATLAAGRRRDPDTAMRHHATRSNEVHARPDVDANRLLDTDAPKRNCAGAMARLKAARAALGASRALTRTMGSRCPGIYRSVGPVSSHERSDAPPGVFCELTNEPSRGASA
jgi:hypothetical protein